MEMCENLNKINASRAFRGVGLTAFGKATMCQLWKNDAICAT
jgi:hypothetical protein